MAAIISVSRAAASFICWGVRGAGDEFHLIEFNSGTSDSRICQSGVERNRRALATREEFSAVVFRHRGVEWNTSLGFEN